MNALKIVIFMLIFFISVGAVCAANSSSGDILSDDGQNTFTDLQNNITHSGDVFELDCDYTFSNETDSKSGVLIDKNNFTINGNNHFIDGNSQSRIFNITGTNITINDLVFANGKADIGGIIDSTGDITLNNVTFIENNVTYVNDHLKYSGGAIANHGGKINCLDSKFIDNYAESGAAIFSERGELNVKNTYFTSAVSNRYGQIWARYSTVNIENSDFINISAIYSPAMSFEYCQNMIITNSRFINLTADISAGAIGLKRNGNLYIKNCEFINTKSFKNAGAINVDYTKDNYNVTMLDCLFYNASSMFGGAYIQLGGNLCLNNSYFINNAATYEGAAIYLSYTQSKINNCTFISNVAWGFDDYSMGGAIYSDSSNLSITDSAFVNNSATAGGGIYALDSDYNITGSTFVNNAEAIFTYYDAGEGYLDNNTYNNDAVTTNQTLEYQYCIDSSTFVFDLINNTINVTTPPSRFDLRDWGWVSPVKQQGHMGACWTFGMVSCLESAILKSYGVELDLSEGNLHHYMLKYFPYGFSRLNEGGFLTLAASYLVGWYGPVFEQEDIYDEVGKLSPFLTSDLDSFHIQDVIYIPGKTMEDIPNIKAAIMKYGALCGCYYAEDGSLGYYNAKTASHYVDKYIGSNHAISIVGWDDNYPKENFLITPPGDGAWIIKNSWSTNFGDDGYMYISYYDQSFLKAIGFIGDAVGIIIENTIPYNKNYEYDYTWLMDFYSDGGNVSYANHFVAEDDDLIAAVGTYFNDSGVNYNLEIYVNDELKLVQSGISPFRGFHTIKLNEYVPIKKDDLLVAVMTSDAMPYIICSNCRVHFIENRSFIYSDGQWVDLLSVNNTVACLKVYTVEDDSKIINNKDIAVDYAGGSYFSVNVATGEGHAVVATSVKFTINGKTTTVNTDKNGMAKIKITDVPGQYVIKTAYNGKTYTNKVTVNQVLTTSKVTVKKTAKSFTLQAKLKINGNLVKGKKITFKFYGKTYKALTNAKGIAKVTIKQNVIKKLKKGKTYTAKVTYIKDTIKTTVKVK